MGKTPWRRVWQPTPLFLPGEFHAQRSLAGYSPEGQKGSDRTEACTKIELNTQYAELRIGMGSVRVREQWAEVLFCFPPVTFKLLSLRDSSRISPLNLVFAGQSSVLCQARVRSDQISRSVVSDSLRPHESQHARLPCPSPTPGVH